MSAPKLPLDRHWVEQTLTPYLRCAFSHAIPYGTDITPAVRSAISFCMHKADCPSDGDDLLFERICLAIEYRYKNLAPDLSIVTESLECLAKFLIRRAQVKGPYELLGRMNIASGTWKKYEAGRLERLRVAAEDENKQNGAPIRVPPVPPKAVPMDDQIDPRLVNAMPGQYTYPELSNTLTVEEDQYYRYQNHLLKESRERSAAPSWLKQVQQAAMTTLPEQASYQDRSWGHGRQPVPPVQSRAPSYSQNLGQRQSPYQSFPPSQQQLRGLPNQTRTTGSTHQADIHGNSAATRYPTVAAATNTRALHTANPVIPTANMSYHQGADQTNAAEQIFFRAFHAEPYQNTHPPPAPRQQTETYPHFVNNPAYSNITSAFPNVQQYL